MLRNSILILLFLSMPAWGQNTKPLIATDGATQTCNTTRMVFSPGNISCAGSVATISGGAFVGQLGAIEQSASVSQNNYITASDSGFLIGNAQRSFNFWMKNTSTSPGYLLSYGTNSNGEGFEIINLPTSSGLTVSNIGATVSANTGIPQDGKWHMVTIIIGSGDVSFYVDGIFVTLQAMPGGFSTVLGGSFYIGRALSGTSFYAQSNIQEVQLFNTELSPDQVFTLWNYGNGTYGTNSISNLINCWHLDGSAVDSVGSNNGTWTGTTAYTTGWVPTDSGYTATYPEWTTAPTAGNTIYTTSNVIVNSLYAHNLYNTGNYSGSLESYVEAGYGYFQQLSHVYQIADLEGQTYIETDNTQDITLGDVNGNINGISMIVINSGASPGVYLNGYGYPVWTSNNGPGYNQGNEVDDGYSDSQWFGQTDFGDTGSLGWSGTANATITAAGAATFTTVTPTSIAGATNGELLCKKSTGEIGVCATLVGVICTSCT